MNARGRLPRGLAVAIPIMAGVLAAFAAHAGEKAASADPWQPLSFLLGSWHGLGTGLGGDASVMHTYEFVLQDNFLQMKTVSIPIAAAEGSPGELHEDWGMFSYDADRGKIVLRQFLTEGFVNTYLLDAVGEDGALTFTTESAENAGGMRARLTFRPLDDDTYETDLALASPGKEFFGCRQMRMTRAKK